MQTNDLNRKIATYELSGKQLRKCMMLSRLYTRVLKIIYIYSALIIIGFIVAVIDGVNRDISGAVLTLIIVLALVIIVVMIIFVNFKNVSKSYDCIKSKLEIEFYYDRLILLLNGSMFTQKSIISYNEINKIVTKKKISLYMTSNIHCPTIPIISSLIQCDDKEKLMNLIENKPVSEEGKYE